MEVCSAWLGGILRWATSARSEGFLAGWPRESSSGSLLGQLSALTGQLSWRPKSFAPVIGHNLSPSALNSGPVRAP